MRARAEQTAVKLNSKQPLNACLCFAAFDDVKPLCIVDSILSYWTVEGCFSSCQIRNKNFSTVINYTNIMPTNFSHCTEFHPKMFASSTTQRTTDYRGNSSLTGLKNLRSNSSPILAKRQAIWYSISLGWDLNESGVSWADRKDTDSDRIHEPERIRSGRARFRDVRGEERKALKDRFPGSSTSWDAFSGWRAGKAEEFSFTLSSAIKKTNQNCYSNRQNPDIFQLIKLKDP